IHRRKRRITKTAAKFRGSFLVSFKFFRTVEGTILEREYTVGKRPFIRLICMFVHHHHAGIDVVYEMQNLSLFNHRLLWGTVFKFAMMAQYEVLEEHDFLALDRKSTRLNSSHVSIS